LYQQQSFCGGQAGSAREAVSTTTMLEFVESGTIVLLSELTTPVSTSSSDSSMEFRICTAPRMPAGKTQPKKKCEQRVVFSFSLYKIVGGMLIKLPSPIALVFILFQVGEKSYLFGLHDMIIERGPRQGQNSTIGAFKQLVFT